jgi:hypothetical protein
MTCNRGGRRSTMGLIVGCLLMMHNGQLNVKVRSQGDDAEDEGIDESDIPGIDLYDSTDANNNIDGILRADSNGNFATLQLSTSSTDLSASTSMSRTPSTANMASTAATSSGNGSSATMSRTSSEQALAAHMHASAHLHPHLPTSNFMTPMSGGAGTLVDGTRGFPTSSSNISLSAFSNSGNTRASSPSTTVTSLLPISPKFRKLRAPGKPAVIKIEVTPYAVSCYLCLVYIDNR